MTNVDAGSEKIEPRYFGMLPKPTRLVTSENKLNRISAVTFSTSFDDKIKREKTATATNVLQTEPNVTGWCMNKSQIARDLWVPSEVFEIFYSEKRFGPFLREVNE